MGARRNNRARKKRFIEHINRDKLPLTLVALHDGKPIGMASLRDNEGIRPNLTPWLGSLVVDPQFRGIKIGEFLIEAVKSQARIFDYNVLYLLAFNPTIPTWYAKLGWHLSGDDELLGHKVTVMNIGL